MPWRGPNGNRKAPTLGDEVLEWIAGHLTVPSGPLAGEPFVPTDEQARFVLRWYQLDPKTGRFVYRRSCLRWPKGKGKSPLFGAVMLAEFCGPTVFDGWDAAGDPVGRPEASPWVQIAATSEDQTDNTYAAAHEMISAHDGKAADQLRIDVGITRLYLRDRAGRFEPVTARSGSREGQPITAALLDETHLWLPRNGGIKLAATLRRNAAKMNRRTAETTNAFRPGERSVAEATHKAANRGQKGLLYEALEGPWVDDLQDVDLLRKSLEVAYGDSTAFVDLDRLVQEVHDDDTTDSDARRFWLNQIVESEDAYIAPRLWEDREAGARAPAKGRQVALGFDGSRFRDATAVRGVDVRSGRMFTVGIWEHPQGPDGRPQEGWEVPRDEVHGKVKQAFGLWDVVRMYCDPPDWDSDIADWHGRWGERVMVFYTRSARRMSPALKAHVLELRSGELKHDGDETATQHALNARLTVEIPAGAEDDPDRHVWKIRKPAPGMFIDACVADVLASQARRDAIAGGALKTTDRRLWTFA